MNAEGGGPAFVRQLPDYGVTGRGQPLIEAGLFRRIGTKKNGRYVLT